MASITIRNLDDQVKAKLRMVAARNGHSMEEEARIILRSALNQPQSKGLGTRIRERFSDARDIELEVPPRSNKPRDPGFGA